MVYWVILILVIGKMLLELIMGRLICIIFLILIKVLELKFLNYIVIKRVDIKVKWGYKEFFDKRNGVRELLKL